MADANGTHITEIGIDIANFSQLINECYVHVDKTDLAYEFLTGHLSAFFSGPDGSARRC